VPKVLIVFPVSEVGGGENVMLNLIRFRERRDLDYSALIVCDADGPLNDRLTALGVPHVRIRRGRMRNPLSLIRATRAARHAIRRIRPDVLLTNSSQGFLYARWAAGHRVPSALYFMSVPDDERLSLLDALARRSPPHKVFAASNAIKDALEKRGVRHVTRVYHGAPEPVATSDGREAVNRRLNELGIPRDARIVLLPGRLQRWKGQLAFVRAFAPIAGTFPDAHGVILGGALFGQEADFKEELDTEIGRLNLETRLHLAGHDVIAPWLERATCVVHSSLAPDAFPNVCIEALAARRPLITNTECGVAEILTPGADAWVVPPRDVDALSAAIRDVLSDSARAARTAESGYRQYAAHCTPSHMVRAIESELCALS
jgi:glycosyltransferase involved in cell wall biosynthesis